MVVFFIGQSRFALESLAVLPVINAFLFIFKSPGWAYQEAAIALLKEGYRKIRNFALGLGILMSLILGLIAFTELSDIWFNTISGLSSELSRFAGIPLMILVIMPALEVLIGLQRAVLVDAHSTKPITFGTVAEGHWNNFGLIPAD